MEVILTTKPPESPIIQISWDGGWSYLEPGTPEYVDALRELSECVGAPLTMDSIALD